MPRILVWDIPTRIFHWSFAVTVSAALGIAFLVDDDSPLFQLHMLFGLSALLLLGARMVLGLAGSRHARFSNFPLRPREVLSYFADALRAKTRLYPGNNPGSALAALLMFLLIPVLAITGTNWTGAMREDLHEIAAWVLLIVIGLHLLGLAWHTIRHKENIAAAMITGKKTGETGDAIPSTHFLPGLIMLLVCGGWITALFSNHQPGVASVRLPLLGLSVPLGEMESGEYGGGSKSGADETGKEHDDD